MFSIQSLSSTLSSQLELTAGYKRGTASGNCFRGLQFNEFGVDGWSRQLASAGTLTFFQNIVGNFKS
jgi:hypothetical protein